MTRRNIKLPSWVLETVPVLVGVSLSFIYFLAVLPAAQPLIWKYILAAVVLALIIRVPASWYYKARLLPALAQYKKARRSGAVLGRAELAKAYTSIASLVPRAQIASPLTIGFSMTPMSFGRTLFLIPGSRSNVGIETPAIST